MSPEDQEPHESPNLHRRQIAAKIAAAAAIAVTVSVDGGMMARAFTAEAPAHDTHPGMHLVVQSAPKSAIATAMYGPDTVSPANIPPRLPLEPGIGYDMIAHQEHPDEAASFEDAEPVDRGLVEEGQHPPTPLDLDKPNGAGTVPADPKTAYGPVDPNRLQLIVPAGQGVQTA